MEAETIVRGFSNTYEESKKPGSVDIDVQFIDGDELERQWKMARRERQKQQENRIWDEFVKEQDVLKAVCKEDPYQFLHQIPETQLKELLEIELSRFKAATEKEKQRGAGDSPKPNKNAVTFEEIKKEDDFFIIHNDDGDEFSGSEEEFLDMDDDLPSTVRERESDDQGSQRDNKRAEKKNQEEHGKNKNEKKQLESCAGSIATNQSKSTENVTTMIESSIYCARIKDLRLKINDVLHDIVISLETMNIATIDPHQLHKMVRRAGEYTQRFQRIHIYQMQRQINDIKRQNGMALPFAKHTQFQSQLVRIVALHQNTLNSLETFLKSFEQTCCLGPCAEQLRTLCNTIKEATAVCGECAVPSDFVAAKELYSDNVFATCNKLEYTINTYITRVNEYMAAAEQVNSLRAEKGHNISKNKQKPKTIGIFNQKTSKNNLSKRSVSDTTQLSMYSLETIRLNQKVHLKNNTKSDKILTVSARNKKDKKSPISPKSHRKTPRNRRPLMRDPHLGLEKRRKRIGPENDIHTMVEGVDVASNKSPHSARLHFKSPRHNSASESKSPDSQRTDFYSPRSPIIVTTPKTPECKSHGSQTPRQCHSPTKGHNKNQQDVPTPGSTARTVRSCSAGPKGSQRPVSAKTETVNKATTLSAVTNARAHTKRNAKNTNETEHPAPTIAKNVTKATSKGQCTKKEKTEALIEDNSTISSNVSISTLKALDSDNNSTLIKGGNNRAENAKNSWKIHQEPSKESNRDSHKDSPRTRTQPRADSRPKNSEAEDGGEVSRLLKHLSGGDTAGSRGERLTGAKNAQLVCVNNTSPRQPTTPQLLKILEETIQKKIPKHLLKTPRVKETDRLRLAFNIPQQIADNMFQYRTKFVQHMLSSSMYANNAIGKPWEMISCVSEQLIDEALLKCAADMEIQSMLKKLYAGEIR